jgi:hypothetical protein
MKEGARETIPAGGNFYNLVKELFEKNQKAGILYEDNGVTRANGMITALFDKEGKQWMRLDDELEIAIDKLYAVNGIFSSDYSEC